jgi:uncharacterized membrane protein
MRLAGRIALWALCVGVAAYAPVVYAFLPPGALVVPTMRAVFEAHSWAIRAHVFAAAIALLIGPAQLSASLRARHPRWHRRLGTIYLGIGVGIGGSAGLVMATHASGGVWARWGFALLAVAWLASGARAYLAARAREFAVHRRWMIRNFSLSLAAVTLRIYLPSALAVGIAFDDAYPVIAWLCWVPNLIVAEWLLRREARVRALVGLSVGPPIGVPRQRSPQRSRAEGD